MRLGIVLALRRLACGNLLDAAGNAGSFGSRALRTSRRACALTDCVRDVTWSRHFSPRVCSGYFIKVENVTQASMHLNSICHLSHRRFIVCTLDLLGVNFRLVTRDSCEPINFGVGCFLCWQGLWSPSPVVVVGTQEYHHVYLPFTA